MKKNRQIVRFTFLQRTTDNLPCAAKRSEMKAFTTELNRFFWEENGVTAIEYALIGSLIAVVIVGAVALIAPVLNTIFESVVAGFS